jgi:hypothetical protein
LLGVAACWTSFALVVHPASAALSVTVNGSQSSYTALPGALSTVFQLSITNNDLAVGGTNATLTSVTFTNGTTGPGTQANKDQDWSALQLWNQTPVINPDQLSTSIQTLPEDPAPIAIASFSNGTVRFSGFSVVIAPGATARLYVVGGPSLIARDSDVLDLGIASWQALTFSNVGVVNGSFPLNPTGSFLVNGMDAAQITNYGVSTPTFAVASKRNLALDVQIPANGYQADVLQRLAVQNLGTALPTDDIVKIEAWIDNGNGIFEPNLDTLLGGLGFTGDRWQRIGPNTALPVGGKRVFFSVDIADHATPGRTIRLSLPTYPSGSTDPSYLGVGVASDNDGPVDKAVSNPSTQALAVIDRVVLSTKPIDPKAIAPGTPDAILLQLVVTNTYSVTKRLTALTATNTAAGSGTQAELDGETQEVALRADADSDGVLDPTDPVLATGLFFDGRAVFRGLAWDLPAGMSGQLFVTGDVSLTSATDGDTLGASLGSASDLEFADPTALSASFPLGPGAAWSVDGMVLAELQNRGAAPQTLAPSSGPALALDVVAPRNGYLDDVLTHVTLVNLGTAAPSDLADVHLYRDGGDGQLGGDDQDLGSFTAGPAGWDSPPLNLPVGAAGARLFVGVTAAASPTDSATVRLAIPTGGLSMQSGNDGPIDGLLANPDALVLSNRALQATLSVSPSAVTVGQPVTVRMTVHNLAGESVNNVAPSSLSLTGTAGLTYATGPVPASAAIVSGGQQIFTWTYTATSVGASRFSGSASGVGASSGQPQQSLPVTSGQVQVFAPAAPLAWTASTAMPLTVNRGQTDVAPLFMTFGDGTSAADVNVLGFRLRIESSTGSGIIPADLLSRIAVSVGAVKHVERTNLETSGTEVDLTLATPILVPHGASITAAVAFDVDSATVIPNFRLSIPDSTYLTAQDARTGAPVVLRLQNASYPLRTGVARVVAEATELDVSAVSASPLDAAQGQHGVQLATLQLANPGITSVTSDVRVASFVIALRDSTGRALATPASAVERLTVWSGPQLLADRPVTASEDSLIDLTLSPLLPVPVNTPLDIRVLADIPAGAALGSWRLALADSGLFDARDPNSGHRVLVVYHPAVVQGPPITVEHPADSVAVLGIPQMPPAVGVGAANVLALTAILRHPDLPPTAAIRLDSLVVRCVDESRNPVAPGPTIERLHVLWNGVEVASLGDPPATGNTMALGLPGVLVGPSGRDTLSLRLDFEPAAPTGTFELILNASGMIAIDADTHLPVVVAADSTFEFPILSGLTRISAPPRTLVAGLVDRMPAALAADGSEIVAGEVTLLNDAVSGSGSITLDHFSIRAGNVSAAAAAVGTAASRVRLYQQGSLWAEAVLQPGDTLATLAGAPLNIDPQAPLAMGLRFVPRAGAAAGLRLGFQASDVGVIQPTNPILAIGVAAPPGKSFPQWTEYGSFTVADFEKSYANFPNPFAAGREPTRFAYYLPGSARVTLRIWTPRGERVATVLDEVSRSQGLHQDDAWDGRNGHGDVVANGVYVAEIVVQLDGGDSRRLLRKVAVVR